MDANFATQFGTGDLLVLDVETGKIMPDCLTPPLVSVGVHGTSPVPWYMIATARSAWVSFDGEDTVGWSTGEAWLRTYVERLLTRSSLATHRGCYDLGCMMEAFPSLYTPIMAALTAGRVYDTRIAEARILGLSHAWYAGLGPRHPLPEAFKCEGTHADGSTFKGTWRDQLPERGKELGLDRVSAKYGGPRLDKSEWALRFIELVDTPVAEWPASARTYCIGDLSATGIAQRKQCKQHGWRNGIITTQTWMAHRAQCDDVKHGRGTAIDPKYC